MATITAPNGWPSSFKEVGIRYERAALPKAKLYLEGLVAFTRGLVRLPDHPRLLRELRLLERQTHRSGRDTVSHPVGDVDDHANAVFGCLYYCAQKKRGVKSYVYDPNGSFGATEVDPKTGRPIVPPFESILSGSHPNNRGIAGPGRNTEPWLDSLAAQFNAANGIRRPK
jgi:hypothetical protein